MLNQLLVCMRISLYVSNQDCFAIKIVIKERFLIDEGVYFDGKWMLFYAHPTEFIAELLV